MKMIVDKVELEEIINTSAINSGVNDMKKFHVVYKIEDSEGNYYIGKHSTNDLDDGYLGSGSWSKYLIENDICVTKTYLGFYDSSEDAYQKEHEFLGDAWKTDVKCKNKTKGGKISEFENFTYSKYCLVKWGVDHHMKSRDFKDNFNFPFKDSVVQEKAHLTLVSKYGCRGSASKIIKDKVESTNIQKYGDYHTLNIESVKSAREKSILLKYGTDNPWKNREVYEQTLLDKHGWKNPMQSEETRKKHKLVMESKDWTERNEKSKIVFLEKYGVSNPMNRPEIKEKHKKSCPHGCKDNHRFDSGNFSKHMQKVHNWTKEQIQRYKDEN